MAIAIKWYGNRILRGVDKQNKRLIQCIVHTISRRAKIDCPVRYGTLKRSIRGIVFKKGGGRIIAGGPAGCAPGVGTPVEYARYVELGTDKMEARPYLRPAGEGFSKSDLSVCVNSVKEK